MEALIFLSFFFLTNAFLSVWIRRDPRIWGSLLGFSVIAALFVGMVSWVGLLFLAALIGLWFFYKEKPNVILFLALIVVTVCFRLHLIPGFLPVQIGGKFQIGLIGAITGLLPLALLVPVSRSLKDWRKVLMGLLAGCIGIAILAGLATIAKATHWDFKWPSFMALRLWSNLFLTSIPEEAFYRGFVQKRLSLYCGNGAALILTSLLFTFTHIYWSPNLAILAFVFLASLLYGGVYLISGKIESAILTHFLLNLIHMTFFEYHAM